MEPSSNPNGNSDDTVVEDLTNDARVCRNELGLVVEDTVKVAIVSPVANRSSDSEVKVSDDVRVSGSETGLGVLVSSVADRSGEEEVKVRGELLELKSGTVMAEIQDLVSGVRVPGKETTLGALVGDSEVKVSGELLEAKNGSVTSDDVVRVSGNESRWDALVSSTASRSGEEEVKVRGEVLESESGTVMAEVQGLVNDVRVPGKETGFGALVGDSEVKFGGELLESKSGNVMVEACAVQDLVSDVRVPGKETGLGVLVGDSEVKVGGELLESKGGSVMVEACAVQDLVGGVRVSGNELGSDGVVLSVVLNGSDVDGSNGVKIGDGLVESEGGSVAMETSSDTDGNDDVVVSDYVGDTKDSKDDLGSVIGYPEKVMDEMITESVVSPVALGNGDISVSNGVKVGAELVESKTETPKMEQFSGQDGGGGTVPGSVDDATVSSNEIGAVMENADKVMDESSSDALASSVPTVNVDKIGADLQDSKTPSSGHDKNGVSRDKSWIVKDENKANVEEKEGEYKVTDLVWAKVKNYPWWPGQIFDPSAAIDKAKKHSNKRAFLIAYFGDQTFAWNKAPNIKHFRKNFGKMVKKGNSKLFHHAVDCALDEAYMRAEFGLACSCLSEEVVSKFKSQVFVNAGITEEASRIDVGDRFSTVANFKPVNTVMSLHDLARKDIGEVSRLEALSVKAQLLSYLRWKGYNQFSTQHLERLDNTLEADSEVQFMEEDKAVEDVKPASVSAKVSSEKLMEDDKMVEDVKPTPVSEKVSSKKRKLNARDSGSRKLQDDGDSVPSKKEKRATNVTPKESLTVSKKENESEKNSGKKNSSTNMTPTDSPSALKKAKKSGKKSGLKAVIEDKGVKEESRNGKADQMATSSSPKTLFKIGDTICKIAKQLSESPTVLQNESQKSERRTKAKNDTA